MSTSNVQCLRRRIIVTGPKVLQAAFGSFQVGDSQSQTDSIFTQLLIAGQLRVGPIACLGFVAGEFGDRLALLAV